VRRAPAVGTAVALTLSLLLTGCSEPADDAGESAAATTSEAPLALPPAPSSSGSSASSSPTTATASTSSTPAEPNERGNIVQVTGQQAGIQGPDGDQEVIFSVDAVVLDQPCAGGAPATNGHYLGVQVRVTTGDLAFLGGTWSMSANDFAILQPDGTMRFDLATEGALQCLAGSDRFPVSALEPGRQYSGTIVLDSPVTSGTLVFAPPGLQGDGWEWQF
jgi:hypothetical protein